MVLIAEVPGLSMDDLDVAISDSALTLKGERRAPKGSRSSVHHRVERQHGSFSRTFNLSTAIDKDRVTAEYRQGLLRVVLPKRGERSARTIKVQTR